MLRSLKIFGFKNFKRKPVQLNGLKRINLLVGINGSGKSSVLELLALSSRFNLIESSNIPTQGFDLLELNSLFGPQTDVVMSFDSTNFSFTVKPRNKSSWLLEKEGSPEGPMEVVAIWSSRPFSEGGNPPHTRPFGNIREIKLEQVDHNDLLEAQTFLKGVHSDQRIFKSKVERLEEYFFEDDKYEIWPTRLAGGIQYLGMLFKAIKTMSSIESSILLIDDLGDGVFPFLRKALIPKLNEEIQKLPESERSQIFATTHNIEIVNIALANPDYCTVYMFDYSGSLIEFNNGKPQKVEASSGIKSTDVIPTVAGMLGLSDLDLGFPEIVVFVEEETKKTFLENLQNNASFVDLLKKYEVKVPFQVGDGNTSKAINNLLDLSKYFAFSEIWSDRYVIFTDYNDKYYEESGAVKDSDSHGKALKRAQEKLVLGKNFLLTKKDSRMVPSIEETYPDTIWKEFKTQKSISEDTPKSWLSKFKGFDKKGKSKSELSKFVGSNISLEVFKSSYPELANLLLK